MVFTLKPLHGWIAGAVLLVIVAAFVFSNRQPRYVPPEQVWQAAQVEAAARGLDPTFLLAIAMAESSFNERADSGYARGLMQLSEAAWRDATDRSYQEAFVWRTNMQVAADHLAMLRDRLEKEERFDYARLAAAYRHGYGFLASIAFDLRRLPETRNLVYQRLFAGEIPHPSEFGVRSVPAIRL